MLGRKMKIKKVCLLVVAVVFLTGCAQRTEEERLAKRMTSLRYRGYRLASEKTTDAIIAQYNRTATAPISSTVVHMVLSVVWFAQEQYEYCYLEADILDRLKEGKSQSMALAMQTIALFGMEFPQLSDAKYEVLKTSLAAADNRTPEQIQMEHKLFLTSLILVSLYHGDPDLAKFGANALGATSQLDYLDPLVGILVEAKKGHFGEVRKELSELRKSDKFQEHTRVMFQELSALAEKADDPGKFIADALERIPAVLATGVLDDIFAEEKMAGLLDQVRSIPEAITGKKDTQQSPADDDLKAAPEE